jgi:hypothetical protein
MAPHGVAGELRDLPAQDMVAICRRYSLLLTNGFENAEKIKRNTKKPTELRGEGGNGRLVIVGQEQ